MSGGHQQFAQGIPLQSFLPTHLQQPQPPAGYQPQYYDQSQHPGAQPQPQQGRSNRPPGTPEGVLDPCCQCGAKRYWNYCYNQKNKNGQPNHAFGKYMWKCETCNLFFLEPNRPTTGYMREALSRKQAKDGGGASAQQPQSAWAHNQRNYAAPVTAPPPQALPVPVQAVMADDNRGDLAQTSMVKLCEMISKNQQAFARHLFSIEQEVTEMNKAFREFISHQGSGSNSVTTQTQAGTLTLSERADADLLDLVNSDAQ